MLLCCMFCVLSDYVLVIAEFIWFFFLSSSRSQLQPVIISLFTLNYMTISDIAFGSLSRKFKFLISATLKFSLYNTLLLCNYLRSRHLHISDRTLSAKSRLWWAKFKHLIILVISFTSKLRKYLPLIQGVPDLVVQTGNFKLYLSRVESSKTGHADKTGCLRV